MKLTIITINYNHKDGLQRTIDSIVNQTFTDFEWIVVDGGSTDGSRELLEQFQDRFSWWCSEPDKGVYNAMNKGVAHATGEYVNYMNSGDTFTSSTILSEIFSKPRSADVLYGLMVRGTIDGKLNNEILLKPNLNWWDFYNCTFNHQATFTRRELFERYGYFDESYQVLADWRHFAQLICVERCSYEFIPQKVAIYEGNGLSDTQWDKIELEQKRIRQEVYPTITFVDYYQLNRLDLVNRFRFSRWIYKALYHFNKRLCR